MTLRLPVRSHHEVDIDMSHERSLAWFGIGMPMSTGSKRVTEFPSLQRFDAWVCTGKLHQGKLVVH